MQARKAKNILLPSYKAHHLQFCYYRLAFRKHVPVHTSEYIYYVYSINNMLTGLFVYQIPAFLELHDSVRREGNL